MKIAFDATALPPMKGGAGNYILHLVRALRELRSGDRFSVIAKAEDVDRLGPWPAGVGFEVIPVSFPLGRPHRLAWEQTGLVRLVRRLDAGLLHSPHYTIPLALHSAARVVTFHDLIFFLYPEHHLRAKVAFFRRMIRWSARAADHVITDSDATRNDAMRLLDMTPDRLTTVHLAAEERFRPVEDAATVAAVCDRYHLQRPFVLTVCTLEPRKNIVGAIRALRIIRDRGMDVRLVVVGAKGWQVGPVFEEVTRQDVASAVTFLGYVPDDDLPALYSACEVFLYPSLYEGFGLPPLEAMACGAAVVAGDRSSMPEVVGSGGLLCHADMPADIAEKVLSVMSDQALRADLRGRARARAHEFSWSQTARRTYDVYVRAIERLPGATNVASASSDAR